MKLIVFFVIYCGAVVSAGDTFGEAVDLVNNNLQTLLTDFHSTLQTVPDSKNWQYIAEVAGVVIKFTTRCVMVVTVEAKRNVELEDKQLPMANYSEIADTMKLLPNASKELMNGLTALLGRTDNITKEDTAQIVDKCNLIHSIFTKATGKLAKHIDTFTNISTKSIEWGETQEKLATAIAKVSGTNKPEYTDYAKDLLRLGEQLSSIAPNISGIEKLVASKVANKGGYFLQLSPVYLMDMYYDFVSKLRKVATKVADGRARISDGYVDNISKGCALIEEMKPLLTATTETCEDFYKNGKSEGECTANLGYSVGKFMEFDAIMATLRTSDRTDGPKL